MREKLIELIMKSGEICYSYTAEEIADHLIANGVTIPVRCKDCNCCDSCRIEWELRQCSDNWNNQYCSQGEVKTE